MAEPRSIELPVKMRDGFEEFKHNFLTHVCAFLNARDNEPSYINLKIDDVVEHKRVDQLKQTLDDAVKNKFGVVVLRESIKVEQDEKVCYIVTPRIELSSLECNLHMCSTGLTKLPAYSPAILPIINGWNQDQAELEKLGERKFIKDEEFPSAESATMQFKFFSESLEQKESWEELCRRIEHKNLTHYVSAFANQKGGRIYYGIEDKDRKIKGQWLEEKDQFCERISKIINGSIYPKEKDKMKWGAEGNLEQPSERYHIEFLPVLDRAGKRPIENTFVIVISVHPFCNGVFSKSPESYKWDNNAKKPVCIDYPDWRRKIQASYNLKETQVDQTTRKRSLEMINMVDNLIDLGTTTDEILQQLSEKHDSPKVTLYLQKAFVHYRTGNVNKVKRSLLKVEDILYSNDEPPVNLMVHELHLNTLKASLERQQGNLEKSLLTTYECLEKAKRLIPGWETAKIWETHGKTLAEAASNEKSVYKRKERLENAIFAWSRAIDLASRMVLQKHPKRPDPEEQAIVNIIHSCHLHIALLHLGFTASGKKLDTRCFKMSSEKLTEEVRNRISAVSIWDRSRYNSLLLSIVSCLLNLKSEDVNKMQETERIPRLQVLVKNVSKRLNYVLSLSDDAENCSSAYFDIVLKNLRDRSDAQDK